MKTMRIISTILISIALFCYGFNFAFAQESLPLQEDGTCQDGYIQIGAPAPGQLPCLRQETAFPQYVSMIYTVSITLAIILATIMIIYGGYKYMTSSGNPETLAEAKDIIFGSIVGLILLVLAALLLRTISPTIVNISQQ